MAILSQVKNMNQDISYLESLPLEVLENILLGLSDKDLISVCSASSTLQSACKDRGIWATKIREINPKIDVRGLDPQLLYRVLVGGAVGLAVAGINILEKLPNTLGPVYRGEITKEYKGNKAVGELCCVRFECADVYGSSGLCNLPEIDIWKRLDMSVRGKYAQKYFLLPEILYPDDTGYNFVTFVFDNAESYKPEQLPLELEGQSLYNKWIATSNIVYSVYIINSFGLVHGNVCPEAFLWKRVREPDIEETRRVKGFKKPEELLVPVPANFSSSRYLINFTNTFPINHYSKYPPPEALFQDEVAVTVLWDSWSTLVTIDEILGVGLFDVSNVDSYMDSVAALQNKNIIDALEESRVAKHLLSWRIMGLFELLYKDFSGMYPEERSTPVYLVEDILSGKDWDTILELSPYFEETVYNYDTFLNLHADSPFGKEKRDFPLFNYLGQLCYDGYALVYVAAASFLSIGKEIWGKREDKYVFIFCLTAFAAGVKMILNTDISLDEVYRKGVRVFGTTVSEIGEREVKETIKEQLVTAGKKMSIFVRFGRFVNFADPKDMVLVMARDLLLDLDMPVYSGSEAAHRRAQITVDTSNYPEDFNSATLEVRDFFGMS
jgi:hypothetical protein